MADGGGWSTARRGRMHDVLTAHVERGEVPAQAAWTSPAPPGVRLDFWTSVYQAIDD